jgi:hypothetical protein
MGKGSAVCFSLLFHCSIYIYIENDLGITLLCIVLCYKRDLDLFGRFMYSLEQWNRVQFIVVKR